MRTYFEVGTVTVPGTVPGKPRNSSPRLSVRPLRDQATAWRAAASAPAIIDAATRSNAVLQASS
jgi:hypothetical protein